MICFMRNESCTERLWTSTASPKNGDPKKNCWHGTSLAKTKEMQPGWPPLLLATSDPARQFPPVNQRGLENQAPNDSTQRQEDRQASRSVFFFGCTEGQVPIKFLSAAFAFLVRGSNVACMLGRTYTALSGTDICIQQPVVCRVQSTYYFCRIMAGFI